jgi:hypothetical protein
MVLVRALHRTRMRSRQSLDMWASSFLAALVLGLPPVGASAWRGVVNDWLDNNRFDRAHSCAALVVADIRLGGMSYPAGYTRFFADVRREARRRCRG